MEITISIPEELEEEIKKIPKEELSEMLKEFLRLKIFELELKKSKELQRFVLEMLSTKSKLTEEEAMKLGEKVKEGLLQELKEKGLV
jgi:metal-responsive CopG/Arc/MetJ family transcriptional regulator